MKLFLLQSSLKAPQGTLAHLVLLSAFALLSLFVYFPGLRCDFLYDDQQDIKQNLSMQTIWPPWIPMFTGNSLPSRPLPYYTFAVNYAISGEHTLSYHLTNLGIHACLALFIFLILSHFLIPLLPQNYRQHSATVSLGMTLLWLIHPLQTQPVLYIYQRIEQLWSLALLSAIYFLVKATSPQNEKYKSIWYLISIMSISAGMLCKETMIAAPFILLLTDRTYLAKSWSELWQERSGYHVTSFANIALLVLLFYFQLDVYTENRQSTSNHWGYLLTQASAITHYLKLCFIPHPLQFEHQRELVKNFSQVAPQFILIISLLLITIMSCCKSPKFGFWGAWFFLILGPSSSFIPTLNPICEYRMLLPLLSIIVISFIAIIHLLSNRQFLLQSVYAVIFFTLMLMSWNRSHTYQNFASLWTDTALKLPNSQIPYVQLGLYYFQHQQYELAYENLIRAYNIAPQDPIVLNNLGAVLFLSAKYNESLKYYKLALELPHPNRITYRNLADTSIKLNDKTHAIQYYRHYIKLAGYEPPACLTLARLLAELPSPEKEASLAEIRHLLDNVLALSNQDPAAKQEADKIMHIYNNSAK